MALALLALFYILFPIAIIWAAERYSLLNKIGAVGLAYVVGVILGNSGILPAEAESLQNTFTTVTVPLALPLLLFSSDVRGWLKLAKKTILSLVLGLISVSVTVTGGYLLVHGLLDDAWQVAGMLIGVYTGGTPNLAAIGTGLGVHPDTYILTHTSDIILSSILFLFLLFLAKPAFRFFLPPFVSPNTDPDITDPILAEHEFESFNGMLAPKYRLPLLKAFGVSALIFAIGGGISFIVPENASTAVAILLITTLGIAASFVPAINRIEKSFQLGLYLIIVFSLVIASMAKFDQFAHANPAVFWYVAIAVYGSLVLHVLLSAIFRIDVDTTIITATALVFSPPFVPVVAAALKNKTVILSGLTAGIIGYAVGNYLGISIAYFLRSL